MRIPFKKLKAKKVLIQLPEGLKSKAVEIAKELEAKGYTALISGEPCFGACDVRTFPGAVTLHYGHSPMVKAENIVYEEYPVDIDAEAIASKALPKLKKYATIGLITTVQHAHQLEGAKKALEKAGKKVIIGNKAGRVAHPGQVLGCDFSTALSISGKVDAFLFIGTGMFHPLGAAYYTEKPVIAADPITGEAEEVDAHQWIKARSLRMTKALYAKSYGIVVSTKPGQANMRLAEELHKRLTDSVIIVLDHITPDAFLPYDLDAFVITACPRIVIDDWRNYAKPLLLPDEV